MKIKERKFVAGQMVRLFGMLDYPEFNDEIVEILCDKIIDSDEHAYYIRTCNKKLANAIDWIYEKRLEAV